MPELVDYQEFVNPIFRIELNLAKDAEDEQVFKGTDELVFSFEDDDILESFAIWFDKTIESCSEHLKPQYSKIQEVTPEDLRKEFEEIRRMRLLIRSQGAKHDHHHDVKRVNVTVRDGNPIEKLITSMKQHSVSSAMVQDFDEKLYP